MQNRLFEGIKTTAKVTAISVCCKWMHPMCCLTNGLLVSLIWGSFKNCSARSLIGLPSGMDPRVVERAPTVWSSWETFRRTKRFIFKVTLRIVSLDWVCYTFSTLHFHPVPSLFSSSVCPFFVLLSFLLFRSLFFFLRFFLSLSLSPLSV